MPVRRRIKSPLTRPAGGPRAAALLRERYIWSVFPCQAAWPLPLMEPGPASFLGALLLVSAMPQ